MPTPEEHTLTLEGTVLCEDNAPAAVLQVALSHASHRAAARLPSTSFAIVPRFVRVAGEAPTTRDASLLWMPWLVGVYVTALKVSLLAAIVSADALDALGRRGQPVLDALGLAAAQVASG